MRNEAVAAVGVLDWETEQSHHDDGDSYVAHLPWRRNDFLASPYYRVFPWKGGWAYGRPEHPELGKCDGRTKRLEDAQQKCTEDFAVVARLHRWHLHMINHEPPACGVGARRLRQPIPG